MSNISFSVHPRVEPSKVAEFQLANEQLVDDPHEEFADMVASERVSVVNTHEEASNPLPLLRFCLPHVDDHGIKVLCAHVQQTHGRFADGGGCFHGTVLERPSTSFFPPMEWL